MRCSGCAYELLVRARARALHPSPRSLPATASRPERFALDIALLEGNFREAQKRAHPDFFGAAPPEARAAAAASSTALNVAYRALRSPIQRAQHLLALRGVDVLGEGEGAAAGRPVSPQLLAQVMEAREAVGEPGTPLPALLALQRRAEGAVAGCMEDLGAACEGGQWARAADITVALSYYSKLAEEAAEAAEARAHKEAGH